MSKTPEGPKEERGYLEETRLGRLLMPYPIRREGELSPIQKMTERKLDRELSKTAKRAFIGITAAFIIFEIANTCQILSTR